MLNFWKGWLLKKLFVPQSFFKWWPLKETFDSFLKETFDSFLKETFAHLLSGLQRGRMCFFSVVLRL